MVLIDKGKDWLRPILVDRGTVHVAVYSCEHRYFAVTRVNAVKHYNFLYIWARSNNQYHSVAMTVECHGVLILRGAPVVRKLCACAASFLHQNYQ